MSDDKLSDDPKVHDFLLKGATIVAGDRTPAIGSAPSKFLDVLTNQMCVLLTLRMAGIDMYDRIYGALSRSTPDGRPNYEHVMVRCERTATKFVDEYLMVTRLQMEAALAEQLSTAEKASKEPLGIMLGGFMSPDKVRQHQEDVLEKFNKACEELRENTMSAWREIWQEQEESRRILAGDLTVSPTKD